MSYGREREPVYWIAVRALDAFVRARFDLTIAGGANIPVRGGAVLAANHVSHLDPVVLIVALHRLGRKVRFMSVSEAFDHPLGGWFVRAGRHIPVEPGGRNLRALRQAGEALEAGELILLYPEGTIPTAGQIEDAKLGVAVLATRHRVPIIPLGLWGVGGDERLPAGGARRRAALQVGVPLTLDGSCGVAEPRARRRSFEKTAATTLASIRDLVTAARERTHA
ncbi:MAG: lysophospholipid acyltransferase family protein [Egibacteraceae bacterium]